MVTTERFPSLSCKETRNFPKNERKGWRTRGPPCLFHWWKTLSALMSLRSCTFHQVDSLLCRSCSWTAHTTLKESHKQINSKNFHEREKWGLKRPSAAIKTCMDNTAVIMLSKHLRRLMIMQPRSSNKKKMEIPQLKNREKATCDCTSLAIGATWDELACVETLQIHVQYGGHVDIPCSTDGLCPRDPNPSDICHNSNHFLPSENQPTLGGQTT